MPVHPGVHFGTIRSAVNPTLSPANVTLAQGATQTFTPTGTGPYTWAITTNNSGGTISSAGLYTAGAPGSSGATDTVTVTDTGASNTTGTASVTVSKGIYAFSNGGGSNGVYTLASFEVSSSARKLAKAAQTFLASAPVGGDTQGMVTGVAFDMERVSGSAGQLITAEIHSLTGTGAISDQGAGNAFSSGTVDASVAMPLTGTKYRVLIPMTPGTALTVGNNYAVTFKSAVGISAYVYYTPANDPNSGAAWAFNQRVKPGGWVSRGVYTSSPQNYIKDTTKNLSGNVFFGEIYPAPTTTSVSPTSTAMNGSAFTLTVNGTNFFAASTVNWNGAARTTTYVSATQLTAAIPASDLLSPGGAQSVTVNTPAPGGGTSGAQTFTVVPDVTISTNTTWASGSTNSYRNITVNSGATLTIGGNSTVSSTGTFLITANSTVKMQSTQNTAKVSGAWSGLGSSITGVTMQIDSGSSLNADGQGYTGGGTGGSGSCSATAGFGNGPGGGNTGSGGGNNSAGGGGYAGVGGRGGNADTASWGGLTYSREAANILAPSALGSGGACAYNNPGGGAGGGLINLTVTGTLTNNGTISANGAVPADTGSIGFGWDGAGAGGSVYVVSGTLAGTGTYAANGGSTPTGGLVSSPYGGAPGGGGRVAIHYTSTALAGSPCAVFNLGYATASAGVIREGGPTAAAAGTVRYVDDTASGTANALTGAQTVSCDQTWNVTQNSIASLTINNGASLGIGGSASTMLTTSGDLTVTANSNLVALGFQTTAKVSGSWAGKGGIFSIGGNVSVASGSSINADAQGFFEGLGPGGGVTSGGGGQAGGSYGGTGGNGSNGGSSSATYGSSSSPIDLGSGGGTSVSSPTLNDPPAIGSSTVYEGGLGGGALKLTVTGTLSNSGRISADGQNALTDWSGGGSGGSVWLIVSGAYSGAGTITAKGGNSNNSASGGGGGGRVYVSVGSGSPSPTAAGGTSGSYPGNAGTHTP